MFRHNLLISLRSFKRHKTTFFINLIGLSTGLACALLIFLWVQDEMNVDKYNAKDSRLYQVMKNVPTNNGTLTLENTPGRLAESLAEEIPEIEYAVSIVPSIRWFSSKGILSTENKRIKASGQFVSEDYFDVFSCDFTQGDEKKFSMDKNNIAISETLALRMFNSTTDVVGNVVEWNQEMLKGLYIITGVFKEPPPGSTAKFDILFNYDLFLAKNPKLENWANSDPNTFVIIKKGADLNELNKKITDLIKIKIPNSEVTLFLQQYSNRYLYGHYENGVVVGGRIAYIKLFSIIALFILIIACINFMNLSMAEMSGRFKEIGIKKAIGAGRKTLVFQYLGESVLMACVSAISSVALVWLVLPTFNDLTGKYLTIDLNAKLIVAVSMIVLFAGLISGIYPALYVSGFSTIKMLRGKLGPFVEGVSPRKALVIFQFTISVIMIVSVWVIYKQMHLIQSKNLGYNRDNVVYFEQGGEENPDNDEARKSDLESFLAAVRNTPGVLHASNFRHSIVNRNGGTSSVNWPEKKWDTQIDFTDLPVGYDFIETLGINIKEGKSFSKEYPVYRATVIFNEEAIRQMNLKDPIGKVVNIWGEDREIIGVAEDFHFQSFYDDIKPLFFDLSLNPRVSKIIVKIRTGTERETIERLQSLYHTYNPGLPFEYSFLDNDYQSLYESENRIALLSRYFAIMAILISCLGLFGLAAFTAQRRIKEIGIRKILGSTDFGIVRLLSGDFTKIVLIAIVIALPVSYIIARNWLNEFAFRIDLEWWYFVTAGLIALLIAWFTVGLQTVRAARVNPVECLKSE